ncbi:glycoside hydrolase family 19 protein [Micromonospora okii]|uniref:glycoside hydrolase family 19 protein n=1 Tax=Micromonospora okii TaxID=1182970 RepID=UPI001E489795|nr:glycoside hydrolase family 19 protein [Micromonospora okii]
MAGKMRAAQAAQQSVTRFGATQLAWLIISAVGMLPLAVLAALALVVLIIIILLSGSQMTSYSPDPSSTLGPGAGGSVLIELAGGDGDGAFDEESLRDRDLVAPIKAAAGKCDLLTPVIIAAQIEYASDFDADKEGPQGRKGLSQLTPDVFDRFGEDDDDSGEASALDPEDSIHAHARYFCHLAEETQRLLDAKKVVGDHLTLTLMAWEQGLEAVERQGGMPVIVLDSYPFRVRGLFARYTVDGLTTPDDSPSPSPSASARATPQDGGDGPGDDAGGGASLVSRAAFDAMFPARNPFYTYAGLTDAMAKFPAFAGTGDERTRKRELAAFLANIDHESGGLAHVEEIDRNAWGNYCDGGQPYGCPAGRSAYHGRGPIQLSWNSNYKAAGDALGLDLLNNPDLVKTDPSVAWQTALWFWMTQRGAGTMTPHAAMTGGGGFGESIRSINGGLECGGGNPAQVGARVEAYRRFTAALGVDPGDGSTLTC